MFLFAGGREREVIECQEETEQDLRERERGRDAVWAAARREDRARRRIAAQDFRSGPWIPDPVRKAG